MKAETRNLDSASPRDASSSLPAAGIACWNDTGIYGQGSCAKLEHFVHCRNCPVYSNAALQLLNRPLPSDYRREWAEHLAKERKLREAGHSSAVVFRLGTEWLALPTRVFAQVAEKRPIHSLPHSRMGLVLGLANIGGELVICISLGNLLGMGTSANPQGAGAPYHRLLVAQWQAARLAFPVDEVHGPQRFHPRDLIVPPATLARANLAYTRDLLPWRQGAAGLLDPDLLFSTLDRSLS